jgi:hypothetical protein
MALAKNSFLKVLPVTILSGDAVAGSKTLTYTNPGITAGYARVEDTSSIMIYYNGQGIPNSISDGAAISKYYYTVVSTLDPALPMDMSANSVPSDTSTTVISIKVNPNFTAPGYSWSTGGTASFATNVMTLVSAPSGGSIVLGQAITSTTGIDPGTEILSLASGTLNVPGSTYILSTTPGTLGTRSFTTGLGAVSHPTTNFLVSDSFIVTYFYVIYTVV